MNDPLPRRAFLRRTALLASASVSALSRPARAAGRSGPAATLPHDRDQPYYAFPLADLAPADARVTRRSEASLIERRDGTVFAAYAAHAGRGDNAPAPLVGKLLSAAGRPLEAERVLVAPPPGGFNAMSPALQRLPDGSMGMLFSYRQSQKEASRRFMRSADEGATWSDPVVVTAGGYRTGCHDRFTVHSTGRLLAPCHCTDDWDKHHLHVRVAYSDDLGATWTTGDRIEQPYVRWFNPNGGGFLGNVESGCIEPGIVERADGTLLMTIRTAMGTQFCSESIDRGGAWSVPHSMEVISPTAPARIARLPGGDDLLLLWTTDVADRPLGAGPGRHTIMAGISTDGGRSWPHARRRVLVRDFTRSVDYPSLLVKGGEAWITLRVSTGKAVLEGRTSTSLMRVPLAWFSAV